ncbi:hypothetical protein LCGC14_0709420 [marine sediment metagenome]|uniref:Uncharacterized protein n=1 Tax=marine sediment metagenome TaxID=412755 RepID=A0A0F9QFI4_9ZZZZ
MGIVFQAGPLDLHNGEEQSPRVLFQFCVYGASSSRPPHGVHNRLPNQPAWSRNTHQLVPIQRAGRTRCSREDSMPHGALSDPANAATGAIGTKMIGSVVRHRTRPRMKLRKGEWTRSLTRSNTSPMTKMSR